MVECNGLENRRGATHPEFESLPLRFSSIVQKPSNPKGKKVFAYVDEKNGPCEALRRKQGECFLQKENLLTRKGRRFLLMQGE